MADALAQLKERLADLSDFSGIASLLSWDQQTQMPPAGVRHRADQMALVQRLVHQRISDPEIGRLLDQVGELDPETDDGALVRLVRRDHEKALRVPTELRVEMSRAATEARAVWVRAKAESDFASFLPHLERTVELKLRYVDCFEPREEPYDILLDDYERETTTAEVRETFDVLKPALVSLIAELRDREVDDSFLNGDYPADVQRRLAHEVVDLFGHRPDSWRIDPTEHPFATRMGVDDVRITTKYEPDSLKSLFSTMHEYGHGLYSHQLPAHLQRLPTGGPCSLGIHESQSRLWENLVGRSMPFWRFFYPRVQDAYGDRLAGVSVEQFVAAINKVRPWFIRIKADEVTYGMHVMLRFELEQDIVNGRIELRDLPEVWNQRMWDYLGVEVPDDAHGVLQDIHWSQGSIGYFSTYLLGTVMSVQIWEAAQR
ncbi:MAG TPA: carboxypeptidase M32, partial [Gaiellaceae bacterium]|nr:carboxypeptidase M32 [Gaiellaceae bacterium]